VCVCVYSVFIACTHSWNMQHSTFNMQFRLSLYIYIYIYIYMYTLSCNVQHGKCNSYMCRLGYYRYMVWSSLHAPVEPCICYQHLHAFAYMWGSDGNGGWTLQRILPSSHPILFYPTLSHPRKWRQEVKAGSEGRKWRN
jgi:hypothetical protein